MKGKIIFFNRDSQVGIILGNDGIRYSCNCDDFLNGIRDLMDSVEVDFVPADGVARQIVYINSNSNQVINTGYSPKSRLAYILLGLFLGMLGIHNFYAGFTGRGIAQLLISLLSCGLLAVGVFIWNIVEIVTQKTDSMGVEFTN